MLAGVGMGIDWLMDTRMAKAPLLWVGLLCFSLATFLGTLVHIARLKALKTRRCLLFLAIDCALPCIRLASCSAPISVMGPPSGRRRALTKFADKL